MPGGTEGHTYLNLHLRAAALFKDYDLLLPLGMKGLRSSGLFKFKFHPQTKSL